MGEQKDTCRSMKNKVNSLVGKGAESTNWRLAHQNEITHAGRKGIYRHGVYSSCKSSLSGYDADTRPRKINTKYIFLQIIF